MNNKINITSHSNSNRSSSNNIHNPHHSHHSYQQATMTDISLKLEECFSELQEYNYTSKNATSEKSPAKVINEIKRLIETIVDNYNQIALQTYQPILRRYEQQIRVKTKYIIKLTLQRDAMEEKILNMMYKEKEFDKFKKEKNIIYENGRFLWNDHKDNEILILRAENSNLKTQIEKDKKEYQQLKVEFMNLTKQNLTEHQSIMSVISKNDNNNNNMSNHCSNRKKNINTITNANTLVNLNSSDDGNSKEKCNKNIKKKISFGDIFLNNLTPKDIIPTSPYKKIVSSFSNRQNEKNEKNYTKTKSGKSMIRNNKKYKCNSIKNLFVPTTSIINNYFMVKSPTSKINSQRSFKIESSYLKSGSIVEYKNQRQEDNMDLAKKNITSKLNVVKNKK